jgi:Flp pilus assembly pilin Flp
MLVGWVVVGGSEPEGAAVAARLNDALGGFILGTVRHLPLLRSQPAVAAILGERLLPGGAGTGLAARLRWQLLSLPVVAGSAVHLLGAVARQAALVVGRLAGVMIMAGVLGLIAVVVMPVFGHMDAIAQVSAWVSSRWQALGEMLP